MEEYHNMFIVSGPQMTISLKITYSSSLFILQNLHHTMALQPNFLFVYTFDKSFLDADRYPLIDRIW